MERFAINCTEVGIFRLKEAVMHPRSSLVNLFLVLELTLLVSACATAPYTGRRQFMVVSEKSELSSANKSFDELLSKYRNSSDPALNALVNRVGGRLAAAADRPDYHWEFLVLEGDQETRAFCFPGGKAGIFTGALKYTRDEAGLATVLAHEMGHALANHTAERQSQATVAHMGGIGIGLGTAGVGAVAGETIAEGYSLGIRHGILPTYTSAQELEADKIGLILMAKAGYDPKLALDFWRRMMTDEDVKLRPPQFLTAHPRDDRHMQALVDFLPEAETHYVPAAVPAPTAAPPQEMMPPAASPPPAMLPQEPPAPVQPTPPVASSAAGSLRTCSSPDAAGLKGPRSRAARSSLPLRQTTTPTRMIWN